MTQSTTTTTIETIYKKVLNCSFTGSYDSRSGLLKNAYEECLYFELYQASLKVEKQKTLLLVYKEVQLQSG